MKTTTRPAIYIIESLKLDDEEERLCEGEVLARHLDLAGLEHKYTYIRTSKELSTILARFRESRFRYLHLSCHGSDSEISLTLDSIRLRDLAVQLGSVLNGRRLFLSACRATTQNFAKQLFDLAPTCYSIIGPARDIKFKDAAIFWASFYHLMLSDDQRLMRHSEMKRAVKSLATVYRTPTTCFFKSPAGVEKFRYPPLPPPHVMRKRLRMRRQK